MSTTREQFAVAAVRAGREMVRAAAAFGVDSAPARQAAQRAQRALDAAESAGCTRADYARARRTH